MDAYFSLLVALTFAAMTLICLLAIVAYAFSLPTKLRVHAPLVDARREDEEGKIPKPEEKESSNETAVRGMTN